MKGIVSQEVWLCWFSPLPALGWLHGMPSLEGGISHLRSRICIKFGLLVILWKSVLTCLTWDYGLLGHSAVVSVLFHFFLTSLTPFWEVEVRVKTLVWMTVSSYSWKLNVLPRLLSGLNCGGVSSQSEPWMVWVNKGTAKSLKITVGYRRVWSLCIYVKEIPLLQWTLCKQLHALM